MFVFLTKSLHVYLICDSESLRSDFTTHLCVMSTHCLACVGEIVVIFVFVKPANGGQRLENQPAFTLATLFAPEMQ